MQTKDRFKEMYELVRNHIKCVITVIYIHQCYNSYIAADNEFINKI